MIIKTMLDELFTQINEVSHFEDMAIYKVIQDENINMYYRYSQNKNNNLLDKLNNKISWNEFVLKSINTKQSLLNEDGSYGTDYDLKNISSYVIPIVFRGETVFVIEAISFDKDTLCTEEQIRDIDEIVSSFEQFFCLEDMIRIDIVRDRMSLAF